MPAFGTTVRIKIIFRVTVGYQKAGTGFLKRVWKEVVSDRSKQKL